MTIMLSYGIIALLFLQCEIPRTRANVLIPGARDIFVLMSSSVYEVVKFKLNSLCIM